MQDSLNSILETIKFLLVIILPHEESFGYLVLASVATVLVGTLFFIMYAIQNWHGTTFPKYVKVPESDFGSFLEDGDSDSSSGYFQAESLESVQLLEQIRHPGDEVDFEP